MAPILADSRTVINSDGRVVGHVRWRHGGRALLAPLDGVPFWVDLGSLDAADDDGVLIESEELDRARGLSLAAAVRFEQLAAARLPFSPRRVKGLF